MPDPISVGVGAQTTFIDPSKQGVDVDDVKFDGKLEGEKVVLETHAKSIIDKAVEQTQKMHTTSKTLNQRMASGPGSAALAKLLSEYKKLLPDLKAGETTDRAYLGGQMQGVTSQLADDLNLPVDHGALIASVTPGSPAAKAGLRGGGTQTTDGVTTGGDLIVAIDGKEMRDQNAVADAVAGHKPGDKIEIEYYRGNDKKTVSVELAKRPASADSSGSGDQGGGGGDGGGGLLP